MHILTLTMLVKDAWRRSRGDWEEFLLQLDNIDPTLADCFERNMLNRDVFLNLSLGNTQQAIRSAV